MLYNHIMPRWICLLVVVSFVLGLASCGKAACDKVCDCGIGIADGCLENCNDYYDAQNAECQDAFREWASCLDNNACDTFECEGVDDC